MYFTLRTPKGLCLNSDTVQKGSRGVLGMRIRVDRTQTHRAYSMLYPIQTLLFQVVSYHSNMKDKTIADYLRTCD